MSERPTGDRRSLDPTTRLAVLLLLVLCVAGYLTYLLGAATLRRQLGVRLELELRLTQDIAAESLSWLVQSLELWAQQPAMVRILDDDLDNEISALLGRAHDGYPDLVELECLTAGGTVLTATDPQRVGKTVELPWHWQTDFEQGRRAILQGADKQLVALAPVFWQFDERELLGVLRAQVSLDSILTETAQWWAGLSDETGTLLAQVGPTVAAKVDPKATEVHHPGMGWLIQRATPLSLPDRVSGPSWQVLVAERRGVIYRPLLVLRTVGILLTGGAWGVILVVVLSFTRRQRSLVEELTQRTQALEHTTEALHRENQERRQAEAELRESESRFRSLVEQAADPLYVLDAAGHLIEVNRQACESLGYSREELLALSFADIEAESSNAKLFDHWDALAPDSPLTLEALHRRKDGSAFPVELRAVPIDAGEQERIVVLARDLTDRKRDWQGTFESMPDGVWLLDAEGYILHSNRVYEQMLGHEGEDGTGRHCHEVAHGLGDFPPGCRLREMLALDQRLEVEYRNEERQRWFHLTLNPICDASGQVRSAVHVVRDITEWKAAEAELREANEQLEQALTELRRTQQQIIQQERLRALGQMASGIAHDFNNALAPIVGYTDLLLAAPDHLGDAEEVAGHLRTIRTAAQDAAQMVRRMREFYRQREEGEVFEPVDLNPLVEHAVSLTQPKWKDQALAAGRTIAVTLDLGEVPPVSGNEAELREVLTNLIFNAVDAMPQGGTITVRTAGDDPCVLSVADEGAGMTPEDRAHCFEPFYSTKGEAGTGLGLAMVFGIIQRHGGAVEIDSSPGQGTTFRVCLPRWEGDPTRVAETTDVPPQRGLKVLVADDEPAVRDLLVEMLTVDGHTVRSAPDGREALELFTRGTYDLVITDRAMPEMNGDQLAAAIKRLAPTKPVILLTGFGDLMTAAGEHPSRVDRVVGKPVTLQELRDAINAVV